MKKILAVWMLLAVSLLVNIVISVLQRRLSR